MVKLGEIYKSQKYSDMMVIEIINAKKVLVRFFDTECEVFTQSDKVKRGTVKDVMHPVYFGVGFVGAKSSDIIRNNKAKNVWYHMLYRCYSPRAKLTHPTYSECYVCAEWHNYSTFLNWYSDNYVDGFQLDKDIKIEGNKIYSPETCMLVSPKDNAAKAQAKDYVVTTPNGDEIHVHNLADFCRANDLGQPNLVATISGRRDNHKGYTARYK